MDSLFVFNPIHIILVNTTLPANIGAAARAMKTMGFYRLVLVEPKIFPSGDASAVASGAADLLENVSIYPTLEAALQNSELTFATSGRSRSMPWPLINPNEAAQLVQNFLNQSKKQITDEITSNVSIVFGREDRGLTNEELGLCDYHVSIPANEEYGVLNIAAAVQVICYELRMQLLNLRSFRQVIEVQDTPTQSISHTLRLEWDEPPATNQQHSELLNHFKAVLVQLDLVNPNNPRLILQRMNRFGKRLQLDRSEYNFLRGFLARVEKLLSGTSVAQSSKSKDGEKHV